MSSAIAVDRQRTPATVVVREFGDSPARPWSSSQWHDYFRINAGSLLEVPWSEGKAELSEAERRSVAESIQVFQRGESSEGRHMLQCAQDYASKYGDPDYVAVIRLFIREEQRHARDLGRFLRQEKVALLSRTWTDSIFRWLRHRAGLEMSIAVLLTAEVIAKVYYAALREATRSPSLRRLCEQILCDEVAHVRFQAERLAILRRERSRWYLSCVHSFQRFLFGGTCLVVWRGHRRALRAGGFGFRRFWREAWREMNAALRQMDPRTKGIS